MEMNSTLIFFRFVAGITGSYNSFVTEKFKINNLFEIRNFKIILMGTINNYIKNLSPWVKD